MKGNTIVMAFALGMLIMSCSESSDPSPDVVDVKENTTLSSKIQGSWIQVTEGNKDSYHQISLRFDGKMLHWSDSTVNTGGKYAVIRSGSCEVLYLKNDPQVVNKYLMGRPSLTPGLTDVLVSEWRGKVSSNRNYRNVNSTDGWELINEWESSGAQPPMPEGVYASFENNDVSVNFELDGKTEDYTGKFSRPQ